MELGRLDGVAIGTLRRVVEGLDASLVIDVRWRGGALDRLLDERHAALAATVATILRTDGWHVEVEVSYSRYGERGSIDLLAWQASSRTLLVVEIKSELTSIEETLRKHDQKVRLAPAVAAERFGWRPGSATRGARSPGSGSCQIPARLASSATEPRRNASAAARAGSPAPDAAVSTLHHSSRGLGLGAARRHAPRTMCVTPTPLESGTFPAPPTR